ncbi:hypothetical protein GZH47_33155 (plasmid) [Paenibacillus rhizovicinus]|uniref:Uncharacterized protein n=1 Tax=Paenibacillus rhizovicinus TaxID=2704463 RepID=A0A6C0PCJ9_9BACL|nr:hypothetical protein [Paenibacillus rhizovicinus]QHW35743.1 hypothetical protein GZH47_33155 [Paenibacillus rhizovicinus]
MSENNNGKKGFSNDAYIHVTGNIATLKDPDTQQQVHAYSKLMPNNSNHKVANAIVAVNHPNEDEADFYKIEAWSYDPARSAQHDFLMNNCYKGRLVEIRGTLILKKDRNDKNKIYPTIVVDKIIGHGEAGTNGQGSNGGGQQQQQQQGYGQQPPANVGAGQQQFYQQQNGFPPQGQQQGGYAPQGQPGGFPPQGQQQGGGFPPQGQPGGFPPQGQQGGFPPQGQQPNGYGYGAPQGQQGGGYGAPMGAPGQGPFGQGR